MFKHTPIFNTETICDHYSKKDGVNIKYVCTTDLRGSDVPADVFYRETPHPQFGNRYFGLFVSPITSDLLITGADLVEDFEFGMIKDNEGNYHYSQSHHDYKTIDGKMIDGGRAYTRSSGEVEYFKIKDGEFVKISQEG